MLHPHNVSSRCRVVARAHAVTGLPCGRYLDDNRVDSLTGLQGANRLEELHLANQDTDVFLDPSALSAFQHSLRILNLSGNRISKLEPLCRLRRLEELNLRRNLIDDASVRLWQQPL